MSEARRTTALIILDGWGHKEPSDDNAISNAQTPFWDKLWASQPKTLIETSGMAVGLPEGQMGNSEVGHMNLGAGRIVYQNFTHISKAIEDGDFQGNSAITSAIDKAVASGKAVHLLGLLSPGGVHSHEDHLHAAAELAAVRGAKKVYVHAFLDGRDTPPRSAKPSIERMDSKLAELGVGRIASLVGRYYAMDRDNRWDRIEKAYNLMTQGEAEFSAATALEGLEKAYERDEDDEFVSATRVPDQDGKAATIDDGDAVLFMNFRADRARELTRAFIDGDDFPGFKRASQPRLADFVMLTQYSKDIDANCAYPPTPIKNDIGAYLANLGKTQLRIAETEKYAHVTYFFSGGREDVYEGEERIMVPSPNVATYDMQPEMSAVEVTDKLVEAIESGKFDLVVCNYANGDMVGHTGKLDAAVKAAECLDQCLERIHAALERSGGQALVTADHGNCEQMADSSTGQTHTAHTQNPVPLVYLGSDPVQLREGGKLADIAPSLLTLMKLDTPAEMTGQSLVLRA